MQLFLLTMLALAVLAAAGFERLNAAASPAMRRALVVTVSVLLLVEFSTYPFTGEPFQLPKPAIDRWLTTRSQPFVEAEMPVPSPGNRGAHIRQQAQSMLHTAEYGDRWTAVESSIAKTPALRLEHTEPDGRVYSLLPP